MTVSYSGEVPNASSFGCFSKILRKWRGSVYKLIWRELLAYLVLYYTINLIYRYALNEDQKKLFSIIRSYFGAQSQSIPMSFLLGFYVSLVVKRWWEQYRLLPWPDNLALFITAGIPGANETPRLMRRSIVRFALLSFVITMQRVSLGVKKRFPTIQHLVDAGLMLECERKVFEKMDTSVSKYWTPLVWATNIINRARRDGLITSDHIVQTLLVELARIRSQLGGLLSYDTVCVPLVYTQVVTIAIYVYFMGVIMGKQLLPLKPGEEVDLKDPDVYFPLFTLLQFCFYVGWLKVAEVLINPFGEDDDDIEVNWMIDRHLKTVYMIVDEMYDENPELLKDQYWEDVVPKELPYTVASEYYRRHEPPCSTDHYKVKEADCVYVNIQSQKKSTNHDDTYADYESVDTPLVERRKNWFQRQMSRMGSLRSLSSVHSSGDHYNRNKTSLEVNGMINANHVRPQQKISLYDRIIGRSVRSRRSSRSHKQVFKQDVVKELGEREHRLSIGMPSETNHARYPSDIPVMAALVLSPIQESDSSVNNTLHADQPTTTALAQAILQSTQFKDPSVLTADRDCNTEERTSTDSKREEVYV